MSGVNEVAAALDKLGIRVNTLNSFSDTAKDEWRLLLSKFAAAPGGRIPPDVVRETLMYTENKNWLHEALTKGHTILDLGDPLNREISIFYEMEKTEIMDFLMKGIK